MTTVPPKSPCQEIDEEERRNHHEPEPVVAVPPAPPLPPSSSTKTAVEKDRDELRCKIDTITYQSRLKNLMENLDLERKRDRMRLENDLHEEEVKIKKRRFNQEIELLELQIKLNDKKDEHKKWVDNEPQYLEDPVVNIGSMDSDGEQTEIVVSDRIIEMEDVIVYDTASYITERIEYYNNQNTSLPIFLVIDICYGGSVMSGYRIMKAIDSSPAPIYIIVKSFAASMAAVIAGMSDRSYAYPNAIILHHQMSGGSRGNITQHREQLRESEEWWRRLAGPFVERLGLDLDTWIQKMYEANSEGDWKLFGDEAVSNKWVTRIVDRIRKTGQLKHPDTQEGKGCKCRRLFMSGREEGKEGGDRVLPKLGPLDYYWLYNPAGHFQDAG